MLSAGLVALGSGGFLAELSVWSSIAYYGGGPLWGATIRGGAYNRQNKVKEITSGFLVASAVFGSGLFFAGLSVWSFSFSSTGDNSKCPENKIKYTATSTIGSYECVNLNC